MQELNALEIGHVGGASLVTGQINLDLPASVLLDFTPAGLDLTASLSGNPLFVLHVPF